MLLVNYGSHADWAAKMYNICCSLIELSEAPAQLPQIDSSHEHCTLTVFTSTTTTALIRLEANIFVSLAFLTFCCTNCCQHK